MFCYQCEQAAKGTGCTKVGVCGKDSETAALQDLLLYATTGIAQYAHRAAELGYQEREIDVFVVEALFTTVTNVNFDAPNVAGWVRKAAAVKEQALKLYEVACDRNNVSPEELNGATDFTPADTFDALVQQGQDCSISGRIKVLGPDLAGLQELTIYGLKGAAAYADHAQVLDVYDGNIFASFHRILEALTAKPDVGTLTALALSVGELNFQVMELLDKANTETFGHPEPTSVNVNPVAGKAILVSGHDLKDLKELLEQTAGKGVNIYTHGEMLPAHAYPELRKYDHLVGNYGGAWQDQRKEFDAFPGAILMTTNCIQLPRPTYKGRIFTTGLVEWPEVTHIADGDFTPVIDAALFSDGFTEDAERHEILVGFAHNAVLGVADKIVAAVKSGDIKHFFLVGGCDGAKSGRNYYTDFAESAPEDTVILTLACGKFRFNKLDFGDIGGIPRLLDVGQCNDAYSAIKIALALADAFETDVNSLPLSMVLSWYEQKAVAILLTLLHLGIKNIKLGPSLPAFVSPAVLDVLVENFGLAPVTNVAEDLAAALS